MFTQGNMNLIEQENSNPFKKNPPKFKVADRPPPPQPYQNEDKKKIEAKNKQIQRPIFMED